MDVFTVRRAESEDVAEAIAGLGDAFAYDPLMLCLFHEYAKGPRTGAMEFFSILLRARIALDMPAYVLRQDGKVLGAAMGYDTSRPRWPEALAEEMKRFETDTPGFGVRVAAYAKIGDAHEPNEAHYYLGVIGIHPSLQGKGAGTALLDAFCAPSSSDPRSSGVYLDTTNPSGLKFYYGKGFELRGQGNLDGAPVWCVFKRT